VTAILERSLVHAPGTKFRYSGGNMILLGEIIENATKKKFDDFSEEYLLKPLGIDTASWVDRFNDGVWGYKQLVPIQCTLIIEPGLLTVRANSDMNKKLLLAEATLYLLFSKN